MLPPLPFVARSDQFFQGFGSEADRTIKSKNPSIGGELIL
jgi:hypothetical protein